MCINKTCRNGISRYALKFCTGVVCSTHMHSKKFSIGASLAFLIWPTPVLALKEVIVSGDERAILSNIISDGTTDIDVRAATIRDSKLITAMRKGSRIRNFRVVIDNMSPEMKSLIGTRNIQIRITTKNKRGRFGEHVISQSFILEKGKGYYIQWFGPLTWVKRGFGINAHIFTGSGTGPYATFRSTSGTFDREFINASVVR